MLVRVPLVVLAAGFSEQKLPPPQPQAVYAVRGLALLARKGVAGSHWFFYANAGGWARPRNTDCVPLCSAGSAVRIDAHPRLALSPQTPVNVVMVVAVLLSAARLALHASSCCSCQPEHSPPSPPPHTCTYLERCRQLHHRVLSLRAARIQRHRLPRTARVQEPAGVHAGAGVEGRGCRHTRDRVGA
jgi:hypothetical protein